MLAAAVAGIALIHPWRSVDNAPEVEAVQIYVDAMAQAYQAIRSGTATSESFSEAVHGFTSASVPANDGSTGVLLIGRSADRCVFMHWGGRGIGQVGLLPADLPCAGASVAEIPVRPNAGYVPGTGPPFDVTPLVREAHTPIWYIFALAAFAWLALHASLDLFMLVFRPDRMRPGEGRRSARRRR